MARNTKAERERAVRHREAKVRADRAIRNASGNWASYPTSASDITASAPKIKYGFDPKYVQRQYEANRRYRMGVASYVADRGFAIGGLLSILFVILLTVNIISYFLGTPDRTVFGLLTSLQNVPEVDLSFLNWSEVTLGDWGIFNWFRDFINYIIDTVSIIGFLGGSLLNGVIFVVWFLKWVLFGV